MTSWQQWPSTERFASRRIITVPVLIRILIKTYYVIAHCSLNLHLHVPPIWNRHANTVAHKHNTPVYIYVYVFMWLHGICLQAEHVMIFQHHTMVPCLRGTKHVLAACLPAYSLPSRRFKAFGVYLLLEAEVESKGAQVWPPTTYIL